MKYQLLIFRFYLNPQNRKKQHGNLTYRSETVAPGRKCILELSL